ncbi:hypothetical protein [Prochlorococcus sp. MIT 1307]|uniref:hypothetical protein n=1 Tax=Prochlorococcus sp. MIT 1307 TaxID=3096219 RepID=UPI002A75A840|nr:hypothetical protein [Prochlorococcus sp. MIT 1307]
MASSSSPYAVFSADDWTIPAAPIGLGQCVRVRPRKRFQSNASTKNPSGTISTKECSKNLVQLAFA